MTVHVISIVLLPAICSGSASPERARQRSIAYTIPAATMRKMSAKTTYDILTKSKIALA